MFAKSKPNQLEVTSTGNFKKYLRKYWQFYLLMLVPVVYYIIFRYIPMAGNIIAFRRYRAGHSIFGPVFFIALGLMLINKSNKNNNKKD